MSIVVWFTYQRPSVIKRNAFLSSQISAGLGNLVSHGGKSFWCYGTGRPANHAHLYSPKNTINKNTEIYFTESEKKHI